MTNIYEIKKLLRKNREFIENKYPVKKLAIFGSYSRNEQTIDSDIDIIVELKGAIGLEFIDLADDLEKILNNRVDLVSKNGIKDQYYNAIKDDIIYV